MGHFARVASWFSARTESLTSEAKARENGLAQIEKLLSGFGER